MYNRVLSYVFVSLFCLFSCSQNEDAVPETATSGILRLALDESYSPIISQEIAIFKYLYNYATVLDTVIPQETCHDFFLKDSVRMIVSSRNLNENEWSYLKAKNVFPKVYEFARDGLVLLVHSNTNDSVVSVSDLKFILNGSNSGKTLVVDNSKGASVQSLTQLLNIGTDSLKNIYSAETTQGVIEYVSGHSNAIGIISSTWISDKDSPKVQELLKNVKIAKIASDHDSEAFHPFQSEIADSLYPFARTIYIISRESRMGLANGFASFLLGEKGQRVVLKSGLLPSRIPSREVVVSKKSIY